MGRGRSLSPGHRPLRRPGVLPRGRRVRVPRPVQLRRGRRRPALLLRPGRGRGVPVQPGARADHPPHPRKEVPAHAPQRVREGECGHQPPHARPAHRGRRELRRRHPPRRGGWELPRLRLGPCP